MMQALRLTTEDVHRLTGGRLGTIDVGCPVCGPDRRSPINRCRPVLRVWAAGAGFASYFCARCGLSGWTRAEVGGSLDADRLGEMKAKIGQREQERRYKQSAKAARIYGCAGPLRKVPTYLAGRSITCALPSTLRELDPWREGDPLAMIMPFGEPNEPELGRLGAIQPTGMYIRNSDYGADRQIFGVHLTLLAPDGSAKAGTRRDKFMVGPSSGLPLVVAPPNDGLGLIICEGIEDALSAHQATGLGAWAAGAASRLPALADRVPGYIEIVTILVDSDDAGRKFAEQLAMRLAARGIETRATELGLLT